MTGRRGDHARIRAVWAKQIEAGGVVCCRCNRPILPGAPWDLDHRDTPYIEGGFGRRLPACRRCNRSAGGQLGRKRQLARKRIGAPVNFSSLGIEISSDRTATWLALAGRTRRGLLLVELLDPVQGTDATSLVLELWSKHHLHQILIDPRSDTATLAAPLQGQGMPLVEVGPRDVAAAHGIFLDGLRAGQLKHRGNSALSAAMRAAQERPLAGSRAVDRRTGDPAPLVAAELAIYGVPSEADGLGPDDVYVGVF